MQIIHTDLSEKVYQRLKDMILNREFRGGEKLDLNRLAADMQVSRTPLKDAVNRLLADGLLEVKSRSGTYVTRLTIPDFLHVMEIRLMIEEWCLRSLDERCAEELAKKLKKISEKAKGVLEADEFSYMNYLRCDYDFHKTLVQSSANDRLNRLYESQNSFLQILRIHYFDHYERSLEVQHEHERLIQTLEDKHLHQTVDLLRKHIQTSKDKMVSILEANGGAL